MPILILHFADAHIDMANYGRYDPDTLLPVRVTDYLKSLDTIVGTAIEREVDLVIFAGDAYKDRNPHPTFQREWGKRMMRLSQTGIPTLMLVGNHDVSPAAGRAHTLTEFDTLSVPKVMVADNIKLYGPNDLGVPVQVITIPWVPRSKLMTRGETAGKPIAEVFGLIESLVTDMVNDLLTKADPDLPTVLAAHASVDGAKYSSERMVMLGNELVLAQSLARDQRLDYVALGHIHKHQSLNGDSHPPVIYPGSIERIDFGEAKETKGFVLAQVAKGDTSWEFVPLNTRPFVDLAIHLEQAETIMADILDHIPPPAKLEGAVVRLQLSYPADWEALIDDAAITQALESALESKIVKNRQTENRARLGDTAGVETLSPAELLNLYWKATEMDPAEAATLQGLGADIIQVVDRN